MRRNHAVLFAVAAGLLLFHEVPRPATIIGAAIVVVSTLFISWREHQLAKRSANPSLQSPD